jgi:hypothetical protein
MIALYILAGIIIYFLILIYTAWQPIREFMNIINDYNYDRDI